MSSISRTINTRSFNIARTASTQSFNLTQKATMSSSQFGELKVENTNIKTAPGVELSQKQQTLLGSVLDLFAGRPSLAKLQLWTDDATFTDPITIAKGRKQYEPQWYGLQAAFSEIERQSHEVTSAGNPIEMDMTTRYVVKGIGSEKIISSKVLVHLDAAGEKIVKVEDKWNGKLPDSGIANVSSPLQYMNPFWWLQYAGGWAWWCWSFTWETTIWRVRESLSSSVFVLLYRTLLTSISQAFRRLNANSVPLAVSVPKNAQEDAEKGNQ